MVSMLVQNTLRVALDALKLLVVMLRLIEKSDGADDPRFLHGNAERTSLFLKVVVVHCDTFRFDTALTRRQ